MWPNQFPTEVLFGQKPNVPGIKLPQVFATENALVNFSVSRPNRDYDEEISMDITPIVENIINIDNKINGW